MKKIGILALIALAALIQPVWADMEDDLVAGCQSVQVDPEASMEDQEAVCSVAEQKYTSSCSRAGRGTCSSPKKNDTMPNGTNCVCISEEAAAAAAE